MSKPSTATAPKNPLPAKSAWSRGPPLSATTPSSRSQSPAPSTPVTQTHSRRSSTLGQAGPVKYGVGVSRPNMGPPKRKVTFGSIDDNPTVATSASQLPAPVAKSSETVVSFGSLPATAPMTSSWGHVNGKSSISSRPSVVLPMPMSTSSTSVSSVSSSASNSAQISMTATNSTSSTTPALSDASSVRKFDIKSLFQNPSTTSTEGATSPSTRNKTLPMQPTLSLHNPYPSSSLYPTPFHPGAHPYPYMRQNQQHVRSNETRSLSFQSPMLSVPPNISLDTWQPIAAHVSVPPPAGLRRDSLGTSNRRPTTVRIESEDQRKRRLVEVKEKEKAEQAQSAKGAGAELLRLEREAAAAAEAQADGRPEKEDSEIDEQNGASPSATQDGKDMVDQGLSISTSFEQHPRELDPTATKALASDIKAVAYAEGASKPNSHLYNSDNISPKPFLRQTPIPVGPMMTKLELPSLSSNLTATSVNTWLNSCEDSFEAWTIFNPSRPLTDANRILIAGLKMESPDAAHWWDKNRDELKKLPSWNAFAARVRERFMLSNWKMQALSSFFAISQGSGDFLEFVDRLQRARNTLDSAGKPFAISDFMFKNFILFRSNKLLRLRVLSSPSLAYDSIKMDDLITLMSTTWDAMLAESLQCGTTATSHKSVPMTQSSSADSTVANLSRDAIYAAARGCFRCGKMPDWVPHTPRDCPLKVVAATSIMIPESDEDQDGIQALAPSTNRHAAGFDPVAPLQVTANWSDRKAFQAEADSSEVVDWKVKGLLNELTMKNFDSISDQIIEWANKSENERDGRTLIQVIKLVFEKATDEATSSEMYARLCRKIMECISPKIRDDGIRNNKGKPIVGGQLFRKYLLNRCQEDLECGWVVKEAAAVMRATEDRVVKANEKEGDGKGIEPYSDEYYAAQKAKRQSLGLIKFIGELFKLQMPTERVMHECVKKLLGNVDNPEEEDIVSLCTLFTTVGSILDTQRARAHMDFYFSRMKELTKSVHITPHMQSMLQDVLDLRERKWIAWQSQSAAAPTALAQLFEAGVDSGEGSLSTTDEHGPRRGGDRNDYAQVGTSSNIFLLPSSQTAPKSAEFQRRRIISL